MNNEEEAKKIVKDLKENKITYLNVSGRRHSAIFPRQFSSNQIIEIAKALENNSSVTSANFTHNSIDDNTAGLIAKAIKKHPTLTSINLDVNNIGDAGAEHLADAITNNKKITFFNLSCI